MESPLPAHDPTPPECFRWEELEALQGFETQQLADVNYYFWLNRPDDSDDTPLRFLFYLELVFDQSSLLLTSGEDSTAIRLGTAEALVKTAGELQKLHGKITIQRVAAGSFPLWQPAVGQALGAIRLSRNEAGLYLNDALVLDFEVCQIIVRLGRHDGLAVGAWS